METPTSAITNRNGKPLSGETLENFRNNFGGTILSSDQPDYESGRLVWNKMIDRRPDLMARCTGVADVIEAVNFARENHIPVAVRGGGHSVAGYGVMDGGMVIDLSGMKAVLVDPEKKTAKVQGGATWLDVDRETQAFGLVCAGGVVSDTGVGGLTLNGGLSWMRRKLGMSIDSLIGADMVLADGSFVHVSEKENPDLFWAIRGGGGNFGIVTAFEFQLHSLGPMVMQVACFYPMKEAEKVMEFWAEFTKSAPDEITSDCIHWSIPRHPAFPESLQGQAVTALAGMYFGPAEKGQEVLQPLREVAEPLLDLSNIYPYKAVQQMFDPFLPKQTFQCYWKCLYLNDLTPGIREKIIRRARSRPADASLISIRHLGGAIGRVPADATAFGDRSGNFLLSIDTMWEDAADDDKGIQWTRDFFSEMEGLSNGQVYFNFNADMEGKGNLLANSYGSNYDRLVALKSKYDPDNFFRINANIKPEAEAV